MPGFDRTGPSGCGPMTGGGRGFCGPRGFGASRCGASTRFAAGGRGWRRRYRAAETPGLMRGGVGAPSAFQGAHPYAPGDERSRLREYPAWLQEELGAVEERLRKLEVRSAKEGK